MAKSNKLQKLKIKSKSDSSVFSAIFNPETYSLKYENTFSPTQSVNTSGKEQIYSYSKPSALSLTLILDTTDYSTSLSKSLGLSKPKEIGKQVQSFLELTTEMNGEKHAPNRLSVEWGELVFECYLNDLEVKYTLFNRSGIPIRAELQVSFVAHIPDKKRVKEEGKSSPDLTHLRAVQVEENLPMMTNRIYNDPLHYLHIAQVNRLNHFRNLKAGTVLHFPPLET